jgi:isoamylase
VPMLLGGDEIGRTQQGNNNAYCQDNEISWYDWPNADAELLAFTRRVIALQAAHPVFRRRHWFHGRPIRGKEVTDIYWLSPDGTPMSDDEWEQAWSQAVGVLLGGDDLGVDARGEKITDDTFFLVLNAAAAEVTFSLPGGAVASRWQVVLDTRQPALGDDGAVLEGGEGFALDGRALALLRRVD